MANTFPYEDAAIYITWLHLRGKAYAKQVVAGKHRETYSNWEKRHEGDGQLQQLVEQKKIELGLHELRRETREHILFVLRESRGLAERVATEGHPRTIEVLAAWHESLVSMGRFANDVLIDHEPLTDE